MTKENMLLSHLKINVIKSNCSYIIIFSITAPVKVSFESAGRWFEALRLRRRHKHSLSHHSLQSSSSEESDNEEIEEEDNLILLQGLDPKEWKVNYELSCTKIFSCNGMGEEMTDQIRGMLSKSS